MILAHKQLASPNKTGLRYMLLFVLVSFSFVGFGQSGGNDCKLKELPSIVFQSKSSKLLPSAQLILGSVSAMIKNNPVCNVVVTGYGSSNKNSQQLSWDHVNVVINHLVEKEGISLDRFIFSYGNDNGDPTMVDLRVAAPGESGPNSVSPPHPSLRKT